MGKASENISRFFQRLRSFFIHDNLPAMETPENKENPTMESAEKLVENLSQNAQTNVKNVMASFKRIGAGYKRLFTALYILMLGTLLFWLLNKYGLLETFVTYLAAFTVFYWLLVALFVWVRDGFVKKEH